MFSILKKFKDGLKRTAAALGGLASMFSRNISEADIDEIEQALYAADFGYETAEEVVEAIRAQYRKNKELRGKEAAEIGAAVLEKICATLDTDFGDIVEYIKGTQ